MAIMSEIAKKSGLTTEPVAIVWSNEKPEDALEIRPGTWACLMWYYAKAALDGKVTALSRTSFGCSGGAMGIGFVVLLKNTLPEMKRTFAVSSRTDERVRKIRMPMMPILMEFPILIRKKCLKKGNGLRKIHRLRKNF